MQQEIVSKTVGEMIRACLATGSCVHAAQDKDGVPRWIEVTRTAEGWSWASGDIGGVTDCPFDAVWKAVTHDQIAVKGFAGVQLGVAQQALCA